MAEWYPVGDSDDVLCARQGALGRVRLHRPRAINALTHDMVVAMRTQLESWADDDAVGAVVLDGAGDRGLCAGGDIRSLREHIVAGDHEAALSFWADEYRLNALIQRYPKPYVALMTGVVMGGGVGVSAHGSVRLVTPDARVAMPESAIGFFPDVGSLHLLSRAPGELGTHLALSGVTVDGSDAVHCGLADAVVDAAELPRIVERWAGGQPVEAAAVGDVAPRSRLAGARSWVDECYAGDDSRTILARLRQHADAAAREAGELLSTRSPTSVAVTLEAIRRAATLPTLADVLAQDRVLGRSFLRSPDFVEGVRALLVDKDHAPRWKPESLEEVTPDVVRGYFG